jgi:hypothetical protein
MYSQSLTWIKNVRSNMTRARLRRKARGSASFARGPCARRPGVGGVGGGDGVGGVGGGRKLRSRPSPSRRTPPSAGKRVRKRRARPLRKLATNPRARHRWGAAGRKLRSRPLLKLTTTPRPPPAGNRKLRSRPPPSRRTPPSWGKGSDARPRTAASFACGPCGNSQRTLVPDIGGRGRKLRSRPRSLATKETLTPKLTNTGIHGFPNV